MEEEVMISIIGLSFMSLWTITMVGGLAMGSATAIYHVRSGEARAR
jgi:hypothetical protein